MKRTLPHLWLDQHKSVRRSEKVSKMTALLSIKLCVVVIFANSAAAAAADDESWLKFGSNVNYRFSAILDVNGGALPIPPFGFEEAVDGDVRTATTSAGYSVPIDVLTLYDPKTKTVRQRISYYSGIQVDYNDNGTGYSSVPLPYEDDNNNNNVTNNTTTKHKKRQQPHDEWITKRNRFSNQEAIERDRLCFNIGGGDHHPYLNFFPTTKQMLHYTLKNNIVTNEPGIPYRLATLTAKHGSDTEIKPGDCLLPCPNPPYSTNSNTTTDGGMPPLDWFQFSFIEASAGGRQNGPLPLQWTMLARYKVINSHTERWVLRYLNYENITQESITAKLWDEWYNEEFRNDCGDGSSSSGSDLNNDDNGDDNTIAEREIQFNSSYNDDDVADERFDKNNGPHIVSRLNRLGMFFSTTPIPSEEIASSSLSTLSSSTATQLSQFDAFLVQNNRHYGSTTSAEYIRRKAIHDTTVINLRRWNEEYAGITTFAPNEFMDRDIHEVLNFRGGLRRHRGSSSGTTTGHNTNNKNKWLREEGVVAAAAIHTIPKNFDPSILPKAFDWRNTPGVVGPIKDQGFCGSCWAFALAATLESNWFLATNMLSIVDIPEQFIVDCAWDNDGSHACDGGNADSAAHTIAHRFGGIVPTREVYGGYLSVDGKCYVDILQNLGILDNKPNAINSTYTIYIDTWKHDDNGQVITAPWWYVPSRDDIALKQALLAQGPLAITINVVDEMLYYSGGVLDAASCMKNTVDDLDHAIAVIGWGVDTLPDGTQAEHWIVRNSWSALWGDSGYMRVRMGERDCGITTDAGYPGFEDAKRKRNTSSEYFMPLNILQIDRTAL